MLLKRVILASVLAASIECPIVASAEDPVSLELLRPERSVAYRLDSERRGTKNERHFSTTLTIVTGDDDVRVSSSNPNEAAQASRASNGALAVTGDLRAIVDPYNQLETALSALDGNQSAMSVLIGNDVVVVPVSVTKNVHDGGTATMTFTGQVDTKIRGFRANVSVNMHADVAGNRVTSAVAANDVTASMPFRKLRIEQNWTLTRLPLHD